MPVTTDIFYLIDHRLIALVLVVLLLLACTLGFSERSMQYKTSVLLSPKTTANHDSIVRSWPQPADKAALMGGLLFCALHQAAANT